MRTNCKKLLQPTVKNFFNERRLVFKVIQTTPEKPIETAEIAPSGKTETLRAKYEKNGVEKKLKEPVQIKRLIKDTLQDLANKIDGKEETKNQLFAALFESWSKANIEGGMEDYWVNTLFERDCNISIVKKDGKWVFEIKYPDETPALPKMSACPIDVEPGPEPKPAPPEAAPAKPEAAPAEALTKPPSIRAIDAEAETAEKAALDTQKKGKDIRSRLFKKKDAVSGTVKFKDFTEYKSTKIADIYPDAEEGDRIEIRRAGTTTPITAVYHEEKWYYLDSKRSANRVTIEYNDHLTFIPAEQEKRAPKPPEEITSIGYYRVKEEVSWEDLARSIMYDGGRPRGQDFKIKNKPDVAKGKKKMYANSPQMVLVEELGYDYTNEADVKAYADLLKENNKDKLYVWVVVPKEPNRRIPEIEKEEKKEKLKIADAKRDIGQIVEQVELNETILKAYREKLLKDKDVALKETMLDIVNNEKLWNHFWSNNLLKGKEQIQHGFELLGIKPEKIRKVLYEAITKDYNDILQFSEILSACADAKIGAYKTVEGKDGSYGDFKDEYDFFSIANKKETGQTLTKEEQETYDDDKDDYLKKGIDPSNQWAYLNNILRGCAIIMDGVHNMMPTVSAETGQKKMETRGEQREKGKYERAPLSTEDQGDYFLQKFFHPQNALGLEDILEKEVGETTGLDKFFAWITGSDTGYDKEFTQMSDFEKLFSEATAYEMIRLNSPDLETPGKIDKERLVSELNSLILEALMNFKNLYLSSQGNNELRSRVGLLKTRYFGERGGSYDDVGVGQMDFVAKTMKEYGISTDLKMNESKKDFIKNLLHDGFALQRGRESGKVEKHEAPKEWVSYSEMLSKVTNPATREAIMPLLEKQEFRALSAGEQEKAIKQIDELVTKGTFERSQLFEVTAAVDTTTKNWWAGLSKEVVNIPGIGLSVKLGFAVNPQTSEVLFGTIAGKEFELPDQWKANITTAAGVEVTNPKLIFGAGGGFTWMSKGSPESPWRTKINFGGGAAGAASFNPKDIYMGPYVYIGAGETKDYQNQYKQLYGKAYMDNRLDTVDQSLDAKEKARAVRNLPRGVGEFMAEVQYNMKWKDEEMVQYYETHIKKGLQDIAFKYAYEEGTGGITEWEVGGAVDPVKLALLSAALLTLNPAIIGIITVALFARLGVTVGTTIHLKRSLTSMSDAQIEAERKMIADIERMYPGIKIEIEAERYEDMARVKSRELAGNNLERIIGAPSAARAIGTEFEEYNPEKTKEFKDMQKQFAAHKMTLSIDEETKMYSIKPEMVESYRIYIDRGMAIGNGLIMKEDKLLVAGGENLTDLYIKRFDAIYPGEVEGGAVHHTVITISDNPNRTIHEISQGGATGYIEKRYERETASYPEGQKKVGKQYNLLTFEEFKNLTPDKQNQFYTAEKRTAAAIEREQRTKELTEDLELTGSALAIGVKLEENIDLKSLPVQPEKFIKMPQYAARYRKLTTNATLETLKQLDKDIEKENPGIITTDQKLLYKDSLFGLSMSEQRVTVESRLQWAERIYTPYFEEKIKGLEPPPPENITGKELARAFLGGIRQYLKNTPVELKEGESIFTAVGTFNTEGIRRIYAATGQNPNQFREGYDYSQFLATGGEAVEEEQRYIARILLETHSELPAEKEQLVRSRLAKKLFYLGSEDVPNPLIKIMGREDFKKLIKVYEAVKNGQPIPAEYDTTIERFQGICEQVRNAQLGNGVPATIDGVGGYAVLIGNYYFVIQTKLQSGYYETCTNPSSLYNELITVFERSKFESAPVSPVMVAGAAADVTVLESATASVTSAGLNAIGTRTFTREEEETPGGGGDGGGGGKPKGEAGGEGSTGGSMPSGPKLKGPVIEVPSASPRGGGATPEGI